MLLIAFALAIGIPNRKGFFFGRGSILVCISLFGDLRYKNIGGGGFSFSYTSAESNSALLCRNEALS